VAFYFDVGSPASYLAWTQLPALCAAAGSELAYKPMLLGGVYQATGKAAFRRPPTKAVARGVFGAPTTFVGDEMFFGQDRMDMIREELVR